MSIRQYIGARYVTKIYENTLDPSSAEWQASVNYEPLTMVTYNNGSYLSKKQVPASIGNPADNASYWVQTGFYNGQIAQLENDIQTINAALNTISGNIPAFTSDSNVILIGDSWSIGNNIGGTYIGFQTYIEQILPHNDWYISAEGSAGYVHPGSDGHVFLDLLTNLAVSDPDSITDIIIEGGVNDRNETSNDIINAIQSFITYATTRFPNAKLHHLIVNRLYNNINYAFEYIKAYMACAGYGKNFRVYDAHQCVSFDRFIDSLHVDSAGYEQCARYCYDLLQGGKPSIGYTVKTISGSCSDLGWTGNVNVIETPEGLMMIELPEINKTGLNITTTPTIELVFLLNETIPNVNNISNTVCAYVRFIGQSNKQAVPMRLYWKTTSSFALSLNTAVGIDQFYVMGIWPFGH